MSRRIWLVVAIVVLVAASFAATGVAARRASEQRPRYVTQGLDYLHARQRTMAASPRRPTRPGPSSARWRAASGWARARGRRRARTPSTTCRAPIRVAAAASSSRAQRARLLRAHDHGLRRVGQRDRVVVAGTPHSVDLLTMLYSYQDMVDGSPTKGSFSPRAPRRLHAVHTTSWALSLATTSASPSNERFRARRDVARRPAERDTAASPPRPAMARTSSTPRWPSRRSCVAPDGPSIAGKRCRRRAPTSRAPRTPTAGSPVSPGERTDAEATSAAIQAILALGERPDDAYWRVGVNTPIDALGGCSSRRARTGARPGPGDARCQVTSWALVAMRRQSFSSFPKSIGPAESLQVPAGVQDRLAQERREVQVHPHRAHPRDVHRPLSQGDGHQSVGVPPLRRRRQQERAGEDRRLRSHTAAQERRQRRPHVQDRAPRQGRQRQDRRAQVHGRRADADTHPRTHDAAHVQPRSGLPDHVSHVRQHTQALRHADPDPHPDPDRTRPTRTPAQVPTPGTVIGSPIPSPSASASPGAAGAGDGGSAAGFVGGTLLAMLPIGAVISYLLLHRREELLSGASQGAVLAGGGSSWERFKKTLAGSKDLTRPSARE